MAEIFPEEDYGEAMFESLELKGAAVSERVFEGCRFVRCQFAGGAFRRCRFVDCVFEHCDLSNVLVHGSSFRDVKLTDCKVMGVVWPNALGIDHLSFERCVLSYAGFAGLRLKKAVFRDCVARETDFADADLAGADFRGTDLTGARFAKTNLQKADFRGAKNYTIRAEDNRLGKARFSLPEATLLLYGLGIELEE